MSPWSIALQNLTAPPPPPPRDFRECPVCAALFPLTSPGKVYCSTECRKKAGNSPKYFRALEIKTARELNLLIPKKLIPCKECGTKFEQDGRREFCCSECARIHRVNKRRELRQKHAASR